MVPDPSVGEWGLTSGDRLGRTPVLDQSAAEWGGANTVRGTCSGCGGLDLGNARLVYERGRLGGILGRKAVETGEFGARKDAQQALQASCRDGLGESFPCSYYMSQNSTRIKSYGRLKVSAAHIRSCCSTTHVVTLFSSHGDSRVVPLGRLTW